MKCWDFKQDSEIRDHRHVKSIIYSFTWRAPIIVEDTREHRIPDCQHQGSSPGVSHWWHWGEVRWGGAASSTAAAVQNTSTASRRQCARDSPLRCCGSNAETSRFQSLMMQAARFTGKLLHVFRHTCTKTRPVNTILDKQQCVLQTSHTFIRTVYRRAVVPVSRYTDRN